MDMREMVRRTAWRSGTSEELADQVVEAFVHEIGRAILEDGIVPLGEVGTFLGTSFTPGPALAGSPAAPLADVEGYDEGTAPSDS